MSWSGTFLVLVGGAALFNLLAWARRRLGRFRAVVVTRPAALSSASRGEALRRDWEATNALRLAQEADADARARGWHQPDPPCEVEPSYEVEAPAAGPSPAPVPPSTAPHPSMVAVVSPGFLARGSR